MITFYIDLNDCDELDKLAREEERPRAYVIRQLLKEGLKRRSRGIKDEEMIINKVIVLEGKKENAQG